MGNSTFAEINHDLAHRIKDDPEAFGRLVAAWLSGTDSETKETLERRYGFTVRFWGNRDGQWEVAKRKALDPHYGDA